jgi:hypothetical protein
LPITPPDWSVTVPRIRPVLTWENTGKHMSKNAKHQYTIIFTTLAIL